MYGKFCSPLGHKELDMTYWLNNNNLIGSFNSILNAPESQVISSSVNARKRKSNNNKDILQWLILTKLKSRKIKTHTVIRAERGKWCIILKKAKVSLMTDFLTEMAKMRAIKNSYKYKWNNYKRGIEKKTIF